MQPGLENGSVESEGGRGREREREGGREQRHQHRKLSAERERLSESFRTNLRIQVCPPGTIFKKRSARQSRCTRARNPDTAPSWRGLDTVRQTIARFVVSWVMLVVTVFGGKASHLEDW